MSATAYPQPASLRAAALEDYATGYGGSVLELDRAVAAAPGPADLIDLTHGDTRAFLPPPSAAADLVAAVRDNDEAYTAYRGSDSLRRQLAPRLAALLGRPVDPAAELIITPGTQGGLFAALSSLIGPGDVVALPDPDYFMSERIVAYLGARAVRLALDVAPEGCLRLSERTLAQAADARLLLCSHPNNPTGGVYAPDTVAALAEWVADGDRLCIVDQLYCRQLFEGAEFTHLGALPGMAQRTVTLVGPSKTESMSGYRVGVAVAPGPVIDTMERVLAMASLRTTAYAQQVLRHWLDDDGDWIARRTAEHQALRDPLVALLRGIPGVTVASPLGSSYVFPDVAGTAWASARGLSSGSANGSGESDGRASVRGDALAIALKAAGVLISPGYQFGTGAATRFRINFSQDAERLWEACARIERVLRTA
jgi:aspartate/methionine/tyrosine aminotransferase